MKQITLVLHFDNDEDAKAVYQTLKDVRKHGAAGAVYTILGREIVDVKIKGPND